MVVKLWNNDIMGRGRGERKKRGVGKREEGMKREMGGRRVVREGRGGEE